MNMIKNKHGFTLVELLAVIVVLAIVMLVAVQSVLPQMEKARRQTLALDAQTAIESANTYFMNMSLSQPAKGFPSSESDPRCVSIDDLKSEGYFSTKGNYEGSVQVSKNGNNYLFKVWLMKDQLMIMGAGSDGNENKQIVAGDTDGAEGNNVVSYDESVWKGSASEKSKYAGNNCGIAIKN